MYYDLIVRLFNKARKLFNVNKFRSSSKRFRQNCYKRFISECTLLRCMDYLDTNPIDIISDMIFLYQYRLSKTTRDQVREMYVCYIEALNTLIDYASK